VPQPTTLPRDPESDNIHNKNKMPYFHSLDISISSNKSNISWNIEMTASSNDVSDLILTFAIISMFSSKPDEERVRTGKEIN
jgi:hypothetical protein